MNKEDIKGWEEAHYPIEAEEAAQGSWKEALEHSLRKWKGYRPRALAKRGLCKAERGNIRVRGSGDLVHMGDSSTCALCIKSYRKEYDYIDCDFCPLETYLDTQQGLRALQGREGCAVPYEKFIREGNPEVMISALKNTLKFIDENPEWD